MGIDALGFFFTISRPEIPQDQVRAIVSGEICQTVDTAVFPDPVSSLHMIWMAVGMISAVDGLFCREKTTLHGSNPVKILISSSCAWHYTIPQII
jgi:hypothetical protein